jgi:hypothetical protein
MISLYLPKQIPREEYPQTKGHHFSDINQFFAYIGARTNIYIMK